MVEKIAEEAQEIVEAQANGADAAKLEEEMGDLLFAVTNLARHLKIDPETALRATNAKFIRRFGYIEKTLAARGAKPGDATLDEMEALWQEAKGTEALTQATEPMPLHIFDARLRNRRACGLVELHRGETSWVA